ncbi:hypothetical protein F8S13_14085 [Chloroflexia bacterium SDU3-3]|nr:hypothetical protein F8S13_14085 [Chloroflexia bacterium SDU3-3]
MRAYLPQTSLLVVFGACALALGAGASTHAALGTTDPSAISTVFLPMVRTAPSVPTVVFTTLADPQSGIPTEYDVWLLSGPQHQVQKLRTQQSVLDLRWSGDGSYFLNNAGEPYSVNLASTSVYTLPSGANYAWQPGGNRLLSTTADSGFISNADGSGVVQLLPNLADVTFVRWSPDGTQILAGVRANDADYADCYLLDADGSMITKIATIPALTADWTSDGSTIFYLAPDENSIRRLWVQPVGGGDAKPISPLDAAGSTYIWSPDSRYVAYYDRQNGLRVADADGVMHYRSAVDDLERLQWSPDSSNLAYVTTFYSSLGLGSMLWSVNVGSANIRQVSFHSEDIEGIYGDLSGLPIWTDDSSMLVYRTRTSHQLFVRPVAHAAEYSAIGELVAGLLGVDTDGSLLFSRQVGEQYTITRSRVDGSEAEDLALLDKPIQQASVAP